MTTPPRIVSASREISAEPAVIFELIADPSLQPGWDGNENLGHADPGQRVTCAGQVFVMALRSSDAIRENEVYDFEEGRRIAWRPNPPGEPAPGHTWAWELEPLGPGRTRVTHTYDWTRLTDETRLEKARFTTSDRLQASLERLAVLAEACSDDER